MEGGREGEEREGGREGGRERERVGGNWGEPASGQIRLVYVDREGMR